MKLWTRLVMACLALAFALSVVASPALAMSKKKKKEIKREARREMRRNDEGPKPIEGANFSGKPGYFFSDTANTLHQGQIMGALHATFDSWGSDLNIPLGVSYGITDKIMVNVNTNFYSFGGYNYGIYAGGNNPGISGLGNLGFGGKYSFGQVTKTQDLKIAAGCDFLIGPLSNGGTSEFGFDPYGVATWTLADGLQFNGRLGIYISSYSATEDTFNGLGQVTGTQTVSVGISYFQLDLGAAYPFDKDLTGIAELATNGVYGYGNAGGGTPLLVGIRTGHDVQLQACAGLDLGGVVGLFVGGGVVLISQ